MSDNQLKSIFDRVNRLLDERDGIVRDVADIYQEAKSAGYVPKVLRKIVQRARMDPSKRAEEDALQELYEAAMGAVGKAVEAVRAGATWKEAGEEHGVPRATLARAVKVSKHQAKTRIDTAPKPDIISPPEVETLPAATPAHDLETGEIDPPAAPLDDGLTLPPHLDRRQRASA